MCYKININQLCISWFNVVVRSSASVIPNPRETVLVLAYVDHAKAIKFYPNLCVTVHVYACLVVCRSESAAVPSPHHLSWLSLETYKTLFPDDKVYHQIHAL